MNITTTAIYLRIPLWLNRVIESIFVQLPQNDRQHEDIGEILNILKVKDCKVGGSMMVDVDSRRLGKKRKKQQYAREIDDDGQIYTVSPQNLDGRFQHLRSFIFEDSE